MFVYQCTSFITSLRRTTLTKTAFSLKSGALNINYVTLISCDRCLFIISYVWEKLNLEKKKTEVSVPSTWNYSQGTSHACVNA